jgi:mannose-6-phosphate isomerase-like protein (cupin superfamily)
MLLFDPRPRAWISSYRRRIHARARILAFREDGAMTAPLILGPGDGNGHDFGITRFALKATGEDTNGAYSLVEAGGQVGATAHVHHDREEAFYVLEGRVTFLAGEERLTVEPGAFLLVPRGTMHGIRSEGEARLLIMHSPGGFERFFLELGRAVLDGAWSQGSATSSPPSSG